MSEFAFIYRNHNYVLSPEEKQQLMTNIQGWFKDLMAKGHIKDPGFPLDGSGSVIDGRSKTILDGPFAEAKDVIGGFTLVSAKDLDEAKELAKTCPTLEVGGSVEVRLVQSFSFD